MNLVPERNFLDELASLWWMQIDIIKQQREQISIDIKMLETKDKTLMEKSNELESAIYRWSEKNMEIAKYQNKPPFNK